MGQTMRTAHRTLCTRVPYSSAGYFLPAITLLQYRKTMTHSVIAHRLHGMPYDPNCGGFYP